MDNNLIVSDSNSLKALFNEPLYLIKQEFISSEPSSDESQELPSAQNIFNYTGSLAKKIAFIVFSSESSIPAIDKLLFSKTLAALKLNEVEVALSIASTDLCNNFDSAASAFKECKIICFADSQVYGEKLLSIVENNQAKFYLCPSLSELQLDQDLKVKWWNGLKAFIA